MSVMSPHAIAKLQAKGVSTQQKYVHKRIKTLNKASAQDAKILQEVIEATYREVERRPCPEGLWVDIYERINERLRSADLTVNFKSSSWFGSSNQYATYSQMYERNLDKTTGAVRMKDNALNPADLRAVVDDQVTLPKSWAKKSVFSEKRKIHDRMSYTGSTLPETSEESYKRGYGSSDKSKIRRIGEEKTGNNTYETTNSKFNPFAKQVFAALNYGQRPHGASTAYGKSYLVLRSEMKRECLYFGQDTFTVLSAPAKKYLADTKRDRAGSQATYDTLGHVLIWTNDTMRESVYTSCYQGHTLADSSKPATLLEAHIFSDVRMNRDVEEVVLAQEEGTSADDWDRIQTHCYNWARRNNVRVYINHG